MGTCIICHLNQCAQSFSFELLSLNIWPHTWNALKKMTYLYIHPFRLKCRSCMCTWSPHTVSRVGVFCSQQYAKAAQMVQQSQAWFMPAAISGLYKSGVLLSGRVFMLGSRASNLLIASGHCWPLFSPGSHRSESSHQDSFITACFVKLIPKFSPNITYPIW